MKNYLIIYRIKNKYIILIYIYYLNFFFIYYRDFFYQISQEIGNPNYSLFKYSSTNSYELEINPMSSINPEHLNYFRFIGRIMGLAILHKQYLPVNFSFLFYKKLLNKPLGFSDMEFIDPEIYKNIKWLLYEINFDNNNKYIYIYLFF